MTELLFLEDAYLQEADGRVVGQTEGGGIVLDRTVFYPQGGGQPGDSGRLEWDGGSIEVATTVKGEAGQVVLVPVPSDVPLPPIGEPLRQVLNWKRRLRHMRVHTGLHLLSVVIPLPVSGGAIGSDKGRLDFDMPDAIDDKAGVEVALKEMIDRGLSVTEDWITDAELAANPGLVKTMSVKPPTGQGRVRLIRIGSGATQVDLQPCGGTHVRNTAEIGQIRLGKIEKKGARNRRVNMLLAD